MFLFETQSIVWMTDDYLMEKALHVDSHSSCPHGQGRRH